MAGSLLLSLSVILAGGIAPSHTDHKTWAAKKPGSAPLFSRGRFFVPLANGLAPGQLQVALDLVQVRLFVGNLPQGGQSRLGRGQVVDPVRVLCSFKCFGGVLSLEDRKLLEIRPGLHRKPLWPGGGNEGPVAAGGVRGGIRSGNRIHHCRDGSRRYAESLHRHCCCVAVMGMDRCLCFSSYVCFVLLKQTIFPFLDSGIFP
mmetsp:Transcript_9064/g.19014  ORF Transcript_9064/g.19014 Transcript_9064/m.19014 type:complete len:202 (+) Transcript_9064:1338-1943(+)